MSFVPIKSKHKKYFKGKLYTKIFKNISHEVLATGSLGLKFIESGLITSKIFEAVRQSIRKIIKKSGRIFFILFPQTPKTRKPLEIRMGKGKGAVSFWVCKVRAGSILCEINTPNKALGIKALQTAQYRLPLKTKIVFETK